MIAKLDRRHAGLVNARKAMKLSRALELAELTKNTELWADAALHVSERDLKVCAASQRLSRSWLTRLEP